jgi:hypothetical protein
LLEAAKKAFSPVKSGEESGRKKLKKEKKMSTSSDLSSTATSESLSPVKASTGARNKVANPAKLNSEVTEKVHLSFNMTH